VERQTSRLRRDRQSRGPLVGAQLLHGQAALKTHEIEIPNDVGGRACKPDSVPFTRYVCHLRRRRLRENAAIIPLGRASRRDSSSLPEGSNEPGELSPPIWPCTTRGFPCLRCCQRSGGLLPHLFTLTGARSPIRRRPAGLPARYHRAARNGGLSFCGTIRKQQHKLSSALPLPWRYQARCPFLLAPVLRPALRR